MTVVVFNSTVTLLNINLSWLAAEAVLCLEKSMNIRWLSISRDW